MYKQFKLTIFTHNFQSTYLYLKFKNLLLLLNNKLNNFSKNNKGNSFHHRIEVNIRTCMFFVLQLENVVYEYSPCSSHDRHVTHQEAERGTSFTMQMSSKKLSGEQTQQLATMKYKEHTTNFDFKFCALLPDDLIKNFILFQKLLWEIFYIDSEASFSLFQAEIRILFLRRLDFDEWLDT